MGYSSLYEKELEFSIKNGELSAIKNYDNSRSHRSVYSDNDTLKQFVYSRINWSSLPDFEGKKVRVLLSFCPNENGIIEQIKVEHCDDVRFEAEAIRVIKLIPAWDVFYRHGKHEKSKHNIIVIFSDELKRAFQ